MQEFEHVTFSYTPGGRPILDNISHVFEAGKVTSIVARAGVGKSSLLNLVARLRDPQGGSILINGKEIAEVTLGSLRRHVAKVSQFPLFLVDTIRANMQLARADASDAEIEAVCRRTGLWKVLENHAGAANKPLDFVLPRAEGLSGGERRLLAVTRALLLSPSILLLDEPTTGIDAISRSELSGVLRKACKDLTVLLVDHDMEFVVQFADQICCLENGVFVDIGPPADLAARPGLFHDLVQASREAKREAGATKHASSVEWSEKN